jgi:trimeric autotransporter adhesin
MNQDACQGFNPAQLANLRMVAFAAMGASCLSGISSFSQTLPEYILAIPTTSFGAFTNISFPTLSTEVLKALSSAHIAQLSTSACSGITAIQMNAMASNAYRGFRRDCVEQMNPSAWSGAKWDGIQRLSGIELAHNNAACYGISPNILQNIGTEACEGFMPNCLAASSLAWSANSSSLSGCISAIYPTSFSYFTFESMKNIPPVLFKYFTADQVGSLSAAACSSLRAIQILLMEPESYSKMTLACLGQLPCEAVSKMSHWQLERLPPSTFAAFNHNFGCLPVGALWGLSLTQLSFLSASSVQSLSADHFLEMMQIPQLKLELLGPRGLSINNMNRPNFTTVTGLKLRFATGEVGQTVVESPKSIEEVSALTWLHIALSKDAFFEFLDQKQIVEALAPSSFSGLRAAQTRGLSAAAISAIGLEQSSFLLSDAVSGLGEDAFAAVTADAIAGLSADGWKGAESCKQCISVLKQGQISPQVDWNNVTCKIISFLAPHQTVMIGFDRLNQLKTRQTQCGYAVFDYLPWNPVRP